MNHDIIGKLIDCLKKVGIQGIIEDGNDIDLREWIEDSITFITFIVELKTEFQIEFPDNLLTLDSISSLYGLGEVIESILEKNLEKKGESDPEFEQEIEELKQEIEELKQEINFIPQDAPDRDFQIADYQTQIADLNCRIADWIEEMNITKNRNL